MINQNTKSAPTLTLPHRGGNAHAFTLAEVLITLGVIGVVAAMTLPSLINNYQKIAYVNQLKAGYTLVNEGFQRMLALESVFDIEDTELMKAVAENGGDTDKVAAETAVRPIIEKYFKEAGFVSRENLRTESDCNKLVGTGARFWNLGDKSTCSGNFNMQYLMPNGMYMNLYLNSPCTQSSISNEEIKNNGGHMLKSCGHIWLDINGKKGPNQWGRDGFIFALSQNGMVYPFLGHDHNIWYEGKTDDNYVINQCNPSIQSSKGTTCSSRIIDLNNWKMDY